MFVCLLSSCCVYVTILSPHSLFPPDPKELFKELDLDGDHTLDEAEFRIRLKKKFNYDISASDARSMPP